MSQFRTGIPNRNTKQEQLEHAISQQTLAHAFVSQWKNEVKKKKG